MLSPLSCEVYIYQDFCSSRSIKACPWQISEILVPQLYTLEEKTATHSSILAWRIPWTEEPSGLQSMGS